MSTVFEVLCQSLNIKDSLKLNAIVFVFDQALYAKAAEIKWKHSKHFGDIILMIIMGAFYTICKLLGIIRKRSRDADLRYLCVESQVIAEDSELGVLEGQRYTEPFRAVT